MIFKSLSLVCLGAGVFVLMQVLLPLLAFQIWELTSYDKAQILQDPSPVSMRSDLVSADSLDVSIASIDNFPAFVTNTRLVMPYQTFKLSIPKLNLDYTVVKVSSNDFERNLAHLPGSALPGERGNVFITGHSSLPFIPGPNKKIPYFANLPKIKKGDMILVEALGQKFNYVVEGMKIVDPKEVWVIYPPNKEGRFLSLMTCVPPGFNTKRLVVLTKLKQ